MQPRFPLYIPSKGRHEYLITMKALDRMRVPYRVVVEPQEAEAYAKALGDESKVLVLDMEYKRTYKTCATDGDQMRTGAGAARNFIWDHAISEGHEWHWVMDDNIRKFYRTWKNRQVALGDGTGFRLMEDFCLRYENIAMAGPNYFMFVPRKVKVGPVVFNTRIYSCNLIRNDVPFRWRGRYNEDTILSLDMLKAGWCTAQFNAFLQEKLRTQLVKGGNTEEIYGGGTLPKSQMLVDQHPDVARLQWRFGRHHHYVDYRPFKRNKLRRKPDAEIPEGTHDYGMRLVPREVAENR